MIERQPRILAFAGSLRKGSFNRMLLRYAILGAREAGGDVEGLGPEHLTLPLYNGDLEASGSVPEPAEARGARIQPCERLLLASPANHPGTSGVPKKTSEL